MVVSFGDTCILPLMPASVTSLMDTWTAPRAFQEIDVNFPLFIVVWLMLIVGSILGMTVIVAVDDAELPDCPFATSV